MFKLIDILKHCASCMVLLFLLAMSFISNTVVLSVSFIVLFIATLTMIYIFNQPIYKLESYDDNKITENI